MTFRGSLACLAFACAVHAACAAERVSIDRDGLSAAILAETNRERAARGLGELRPEPRLVRAAEAHTRFLVLLGGIRHESFLPGMQSVEDRVRAQGVRSAFVSENLALVPVHGLVMRAKEDGSGVETTVANAGEPDTSELAAILVEAWMKSPGHRDNLLNPKFTHLGCAVQAGSGPASGAIVISAQVFARL